MSKPSIPQGTRDFSAEVVQKRNYIFSVIRDVFELYSFQPLETPAMENIETLLGKYGEEGDKLIFRILDSGNSFSDEFYTEILSDLESFAFPDTFKKEKIYSPESIEKIKLFIRENPNWNKNNIPKLKSEISGKALKYDLTIPFARYIAMNHTKLTFPFRRYQIQPVWRADRPQRGRYREFTQCDADIVGSNSLLNEVELANIYLTVFEKLGIDITVKINSRKILAGLAEIVALPDLTSNKTTSLDVENKMSDITIAIDKLEKIGIIKVKEELSQRGLNEMQISVIEDYLAIEGSNDYKLKKAKLLFQNQPTANNGLNEIKYLLDLCPKLSIDFTLARGLNYYTGIIFEVAATNVKIGSIGGGGRYDDLTGLFGVPNIPGVGISFGVDRIYDVLEEMKLFPENLQVSTKALFFNMGEEESRFAFGIMQKLRSNGIACELYHENAKINKQFTYAEKKNIPFVIIIGSKEVAEQNCQVKNLSTGVQETVAIEKLASYLRNL